MKKIDMNLALGHLGFFQKWGIRNYPSCELNKGYLRERRKKKREKGKMNVYISSSKPNAIFKVQSRRWKQSIAYFSFVSTNRTPKNWDPLSLKLLHQVFRELCRFFAACQLVYKPWSRQAQLTLISNKFIWVSSSLTNSKHVQFN